MVVALRGGINDQGGPWPGQGLEDRVEFQGRYFLYAHHTSYMMLRQSSARMGKKSPKSYVIQ